MHLIFRTPAVSLTYLDAVAVSLNLVNVTSQPKLAQNETIWDCQKDPEAVSVKQQSMWLCTSAPWETHNKHKPAGVQTAAEEQVELSSFLETCSPVSGGMAELGMN